MKFLINLERKIFFPACKIIIYLGIIILIVFLFMINSFFSKNIFTNDSYVTYDMLIDQVSGKPKNIENDIKIPEDIKEYFKDDNIKILN